MTKKKIKKVLKAFLAINNLELRNDDFIVNNVNNFLKQKKLEKKYPINTIVKIVDNFEDGHDFMIGEKVKIIEHDTNFYFRAESLDGGMDCLVYAKTDIELFQEGNDSSI